MGAKPKNILGLRFGKLIVVGRARSNFSNGAMWWCQCDCGHRIACHGTALRAGRTKSCGCIRKAALIKRFMKRDVNSEPYIDPSEALLELCGMA